MTDTLYPPSKPTGAGAPKPPPPSKPQIYNPNRHPHRRNPNIHHRNYRRSYFCLCCFWFILITILLLLLATIVSCILYLLYRPHRPTFSVTAVKITQFNLTVAGAGEDDGTTRLTSKLNLTVSTKNPNKKLVFYYDPIAITCLSDETQIANGSFGNSFVSNPSNITIIRSSLYGNSLILETETVKQMRSDLKKKSGLGLKILLDTEARVKIESIRSKKVGIRIKCEGIHSLIPKGNSSVGATVSDAKCKVDLRIKIWKWSFGS